MKLTIKLESAVLRVLFAATASLSASLACGASGENSQELAKQLANPIASLISVPFQFNYDGGIGPANGSKYYLNVQPVLPIKLNEEWNVISRTVLPLAYQNDVVPGTGSQFGLSDTLQSFFFSPSAVVNGFTWGAGPVLLLPTATEQELGGGKWGAGPTAVALWQGNGWTIGALANHVWSVAGSSSRPGVSSTFIQPFVAYTTPDAWTFTINTESTYNWKNSTWSVPVNFLASKVIRIGTQALSIQAGPRYWATSPESGPSGWGARLNVTLLFPR